MQLLFPRAHTSLAHQQGAGSPVGNFRAVHRAVSLPARIANETKVLACAEAQPRLALRIGALLSGHVGGAIVVAVRMEAGLANLTRHYHRVLLPGSATIQSGL